MSKKRYNQYSEEFKLSVVLDYYPSGMSKNARGIAVKTHPISCDTILSL